MKTITTKIIACFLVLAIALSGCKKNVTGSSSYPIKISFVNLAGTVPLVLNTAYTNPHGEPVTFKKFEYYISNISLVNTAGNETKIAGLYFLVDHENPASTSFEITINGNEYKAIKFLIGVDSTRNVSGVQTGALDPVNGMFWTWNTGYIMAKMEAISAVSTAPFSAVTYHIGGFKTGENSLKQITLNLPENVILKPTASSEIVINANAMSWFKGEHDIKIATDPDCMNPGELAMKIADNYAGMFTVKEVKNQ
ncbi:MAG: MbnP family protein [Bacteroidota bacterium]